MTNVPQRWMIRIGLAFAALLVIAVLALSLSPLGTARADTSREARPPRLEVDLGMPMKAPQSDVAPAAMLAMPVAAPAPATTAPAPAAVPAPMPAIASSGMALKRVLVIDGPFRHGDYVWDDEGVPQGDVVITVDVKAQTIAIFRAGYQIGAAVILYGADDYPTPLGTFPITEKDIDHRSNVYNNAPMPYMMRLTNDGVAIHASSVKWGNATHGCIGVPLAFAKLIFAQARIGTPVIVTSGKMMAVPQGAQMASVGMNN